MYLLQLSMFLYQQVQNTFRDFEECNILRPFMGDTIKEIAKACLTLEGKDSSPTAGIFYCPFLEL